MKYFILLFALVLGCAGPVAAAGAGSTDPPATDGAVGACSHDGAVASDPVSLEMKQASPIDILKIVAQRAGLPIIIAGKNCRTPIDYAAHDTQPTQVFTDIGAKVGLQQGEIDGITFFVDTEDAQYCPQVSDLASISCAATVSLDFRAANVLDLYRILGMKSGLKFTCEKGVYAQVSCHLRDVSVLSIARALAVAAECTLIEKDGGIVVRRVPRPHPTSGGSGSGSESGNADE